jgi:hypothetical protein
MIFHWNVRVEKIESQRVFFDVYLAQQAVAQHYPVLRLNAALEDAILHALTIVFASLCDAPQPSRASFVYR